MKAMLLLFFLLIGETISAQGLVLDIDKEVQRDCTESGDFIRNTALGRRNGMKRSFALERLDGDLRSIRSLPRSLRWFAQSPSDEQFLRRAVIRVFDEPGDPEQFRTRTISECIEYKLGELPW